MGSMKNAQIERGSKTEMKTIRRDGRRKSREKMTVTSVTRRFLHPLDELPSVSKNVTFLSPEFVTDVASAAAAEVLIAGLLGCGTGRL